MRRHGHRGKDASYSNGTLRLPLPCGRTPTYFSWAGMKQRCTNAKREDFKYYGGRGIRFDERWKDFKNFLADMGERPEGMILDRIDVNGPYCKENCRWADRLTQAKNKQANAHQSVKNVILQNATRYEVRI